MNKQIQNSIQLSIGVLIMCVIATIALFFFSCKKKKLMPYPVATETYYTVTFDSKGGSEVKAVKVKKGGTITLPANPTKADFVFGGWFTDDNTFKNQFDAKTPITADITLYAKWDLPDYTVTFDSKGGSEVKAVKVKKGGTITLPANPTKADFVFGGWFTDDNTFKNQFDAKTPITADITLYAKWDLPDYTVTFDSKGGSEVKAVKVKKGNTITLPTNPTKVDFAFGGWFTDDNTFKNQFDATTPITANLTLYAKWDLPDYTVTFDSKGGSEVKAVKVKKGGTITLPANPTKADFVFGGWFTDDNTFKNQFDAKTPITADITLYAKWDLPDYTVTFDSKGGSEVKAVKVKKGGTITLPANPTKADFVFGGWFTDDNTFKNQFDAKTPITADITLYAKWDLPDYTVTFDSKGGSEVKAVKVKKGGTITLPANPTKADFVFGGWFTDDNTFKNQFDAKTPITADITLYAKWDLPDYTVTFNSKGGSEVKAVKVKKGGTITLPANPTKVDFAFGGWFTDDNTFKNQFDATTPITANITLYAKWDVQEYTVTFDSKGGSVVNAITNVKKGSTITLPPNPTKAGFTFGGWFTDDDTFKNQFVATTPITANLTLYAKWDVQEYTVTFNSKGGSTVNAITNVKKGSTITLPPNPTKADFIFGGWFTDDDTFKNQFDATTPITANLTLYAKWNVPEYTVTFNSKGGSEVNAITNVKKGSTITLPPNPTKADFIFGGWFTDDDTFKNQFDATTPVTADITLYAKWDVPEYTVTFNSKGGSAVNAITNVKKGSTIALPPNPTKAGFIFGGWFTDDDTFKNQFDAKTPITANLTLYAKWDVPEYTVTFNSKGGSTVNAITNVKKGSTIALPPNPTKAGFIFGGWFTDDDTFKNQFDAKTPITANLTLYAKWDVPEYTVTFNSKGGSAVNAITNVKKGSTITLPPNPTKAGFTFGGWFTDDNTFKNQFDATTPVTADITLYAKWNAVAPASFSLSSTSFPNGGVIPLKHAYSFGGGSNVSPQLSWANAPAATTSFLIIMEDNEVGNYAHWTAYNIPADKTSVTEGEYGSKDPSQVGSRVGNKYEGPWPPPGITHTYQITVFALDLPTTYFNEDYFPASKAEAERYLGAHILASASITGTFTGK